MNELMKKVARICENAQIGWTFSDDGSSIITDGSYEWMCRIIYSKLEGVIVSAVKGGVVIKPS